MAAYEITSPDGKTYQITAPDGATKEQVLEYAKSKLAPQSGGHPVLDALDRFDKNYKEQPDPSAMQGVNYVGNKYLKGVAHGLGYLAEAGPARDAANLVVAGLGTLNAELGSRTSGKDIRGEAMEPFKAPGVVAPFLERVFRVDNTAEPTGPVNRFAGRIANDLGAASLPIAGIASRPALLLPRTAGVELTRAATQSPLPVLTAGTGLQALASTAGETARQLAPEKYKDMADISGQLFGGVVAPAMVASRIGAIKAIKDAANPQNTSRVANDYVENRLQADVKNYPGAKERLAEAIALQDEIPGFQPRVGQGSGVPSILDMERRVATSGPEQFNKRSIQDVENQQAILRKAEQDLPLLTGRNDVADRLKLAQTERGAIAEQLPEVSAADTGQTLRGARASLKGKYDQLAAEKFNAPVEEANRLNVKIDPAGILAKAVEIGANPILGFDATNAPAILGRIKALGDNRVPGPLLLDSSGRPYRSSSIERIGFDELKAMREAVNQDIAREKGSANPNARQRLRALLEMRGEIDKTAQQAPEQVRKLYNDAVGWYRDEYSPMFNRGVNLKQSLRDITGEQKIPDEKLAGQYFKKLGSTPMSRFVTLYGDSPQAMRSMENHILDTYRREVVKDGVIDPNKHQVFLRNYDPALKQLPEVRRSLDSMGNASALLGERELQLANAQSLLERGNLDRLKFSDPNMPGLDPTKVNAFLAKNRAPFLEAVSSVYGERVAKDHLTTLEKIGKAAEISDRGRLSDNAFPMQSTNPADLRSAFGFTGRTVFNMIRAVTTGRTSTEDMAFTLGAQAASHRIGKALIAAEERAISDPQTAKLIAESIAQPATSERGQTTLRQILEKGGLYLANTATGANNYERMARLRAAPFAVNATQQFAKQQ